MKKLINAVENVVNESLAGFCAAHSDIVRMGEQAPFVQRRNRKPGKVALVSGGGSGHEPLHSGFVGHGMLDAACPGQVFTSPTPDLILAAAAAVDTGGGVPARHEYPHRPPFRPRRCRRSACRPPEPCSSSAQSQSNASPH